MREKLHAYLAERPSGATARELLDLIFTQPGSDPEFGPRFLGALLSRDRRFAFRAAEGRWVSTVHEALSRPLADTSFVVVDLETTGGSPARGDGIIEIGAVRVQGGRSVDRFARLVNPGRSLPPFITRLTGISDEMLADAPPIGAALEEFLRFADGSVLVAHNARFDRSFLDAAARTTRGEPLPHAQLCTLRLTRRLIPGLRSRSLDSLAGHFGIPLVDRHRALGDATVTVEVLLHCLELLGRRGITRLDQLLDLQHQAVDGRRFFCALPRSRAAELPEVPGIYRFVDEGGRLLYIGKAKNLRQRVASYLSDSSGHTAKTLDLIRHIRDVRIEEAGTELEAALREAEEIRSGKPPYNKLGKHLPRIAYVKLTAGDRFPRLSVSARPGGRRSHAFGPFASRAAAERTLDLLARLFRLRTCAGRLRPDPAFSPCLQGQIGCCSIPCAERVDATEYRRQAERLLEFFHGDGAPFRQELERRRERLSTALRFEAAARAQRDIELLDSIQRRQRRLGWVVAGQHFIVLQPTRRAPPALFYVVLHGRLVMRGSLSSTEELQSILAPLGECLAATNGTRLRPDEVDGTTILAAWLSDRGERDGQVIALDAARPLAEQLPEWEAALAELLRVTPGENATGAH